MTLDYRTPEREKAILVGLALNSRRKQEHLESLEELERLATTAGAEVLAHRVQVKDKPNPAFYIGRGLVDELKQQLEDQGGNCIIFDDQLSPAQQRNLEEFLDAKVSRAFAG